MCGSRVRADRLADKQEPENSSQFATKKESHLAAPRAGHVRNTSACDSGECTRSGSGAPLSSVSSARSTRSAEAVVDAQDQR
jgi:hypothetical protein